MVTGKILWFGGQTREGRVNNFGFIQFEESGENKEIYVNRQEVPEDLQNICQNDRSKGEGIVVEFDIQEYKKNGNTQQRAINLTLFKNKGLVVSSNQVLSRNGDNYSLRRNRAITPGDLIEFYFQGDQCIFLQALNYQDFPIETIKAFCENENLESIKSCFIYYLSNLNQPNAIQYILDKIESLDENQILTLFDIVLVSHQELFLISDKLRQKLKDFNLSKYTEFIENNLWSVDEDTQIKLWSEFLDIIHSSDEFSVIFDLLQLYLSNIETQDAIKFIAEKITVLEQSKVKKFLGKSFEYNKEAFLENQSLHPYLREHNFSQYLKVVQQILESDNQSLCQSVVQDLIDFLSSCSESEQALIWRTISYLENSLEYHGHLWDIAPLKYKQKVIRKKYIEFFMLVEEFKNSNYPYSQYISKNYKELYDFDRNDQELAKKWGNNTNSDFVKAKMLSARGAEKLVQYFYQNSGFDVEDIAAHQISNKSELWRQADNCINEGNSQKLIDVKNGRQNVNSHIYSEFCIRKFKEERGQDVVIAAVLSPYLQLKFMNNNGANFRIDSPKYLGELNYSQLQSLTKTFSDSVVRLDMTRGFDPKSYLAPWLFDYNTKFYKEQINIANKLKNLLDDKIPSYEDIKILDKSLYTYIPLFIYANKGIPLTWQKRIPLWVRQFLKLLYRQDNSLLKLPQVYLSILKHFLMMLSSSESNYNPAKILLLLGDSNNPIKIYDPLGIIHDFCQTLDVVWDNRQEACLSDFKIFKFNGKGLLSGKRSDSDFKETTILAYCGGEIEGKGSCGKSPLILGREQTCSVCNKLICPGTNDNYCGFCSYKDWYNKILCEAAINRKKKH